MSSSPDFISQNEPFSPITSNEADNTQFQREINNNIINVAPLSNAVFDEEEQKRFEQRQAEENERNKKISEKQALELKLKNELREKAMLYINEFENKRQEEISKRKAMNIKNEEDNLSNRKLIKEGKKNSWENVVDNISIKESEYKGSKDISRMRSVILNRKNDKVE